MLVSKKLIVIISELLYKEVLIFSVKAGMAFSTFNINAFFFLNLVKCGLRIFNKMAINPRYSYNRKLIYSTCITRQLCGNNTRRRAMHLSLCLLTVHTHKLAMITILVQICGMAMANILHFFSVRILHT